MFAPCINSIKILLVVPTDAHYYKIVENLKQFKIITPAPTCFGSRWNHHQGAVLCLAKTTIMVLLSSSIMLDTPRSEVVWEYWLPTPLASFPFTSPPVRHRVPSGFKRTLMLDTPCSEVVWRVLAIHYNYGFS